MTTVVDRLHDPSEQIRMAALADVLRSSSADTSLLEPVSERIDDSDSEVCQMAAIVLPVFGSASVPALIRGLATHQDVTVRIASASALARIGRDASAAIEALSRGLEAGEAEVRWHSSFALARIGEASVPALCQALASPRPEIQVAAADALALIGPPAKSALPSLKPLQSSSSDDVRLAAISAHARISEDSSELSAVEALLTHTDAHTREAAARRLGEGGESARARWSALLPCLNDVEPGVRAAAALALGRIHAADQTAIDALTRALDDAVADVRANAAAALAHLKASAS
jgi:HEAT repeat protein